MSSDNKENETASTVLRQELKQWEKAFAAANGGRRPGRDDIKKDAAIASKYREYDQLRRAARKIKPVQTTRECKQPQPELARDVLRERPPNAVVSTPRKTISKTALQQAPQLSPVKEEEPTPAFIRNALGPTPQKDGQVLGIFDLLPVCTPSKAAMDSLSKPQTATPFNVSATPSKPKQSSASEAALSRTPASSGKRFYLDSMATPVKRKREDEAATPSTGKRQFATPAFLRRSFPLAPIEEDGDCAAVNAPPFKKRGLVRSLSSIIQGLRKQEEERLDDDWDVLNEIEAEERGDKPAPRVLVEDSQVAEMPLGPDRGVDEDESDAVPDPGSLDAHGNPRKVWKKKGLKRQTKRVIMRPVMQKSKQPEETPESDAKEDGIVAESQLEPRPRKRVCPENQAADENTEQEAQGSEYSDDDLPSEPEALARPCKKPVASPEKPNGGIVTKAARKISAHAHANFRKLKIKNKNSKANGRGRFSRR